jgi:hypothetical protein
LIIFCCFLGFQIQPRNTRPTCIWIFCTANHFPSKSGYRLVYYCIIAKNLRIPQSSILNILVRHHDWLD